MLVTRSLAVLAFLLLAACASRQAPPDHLPPAAASIDWNAAKAITVKMTDFDFTPSKVNFEAGQPAKLTLVNDGTDRHDFSAPAFFAAASLRQGSTGPAGGKISLAKGQSAEIDLVPGAPGAYPLTCTEFLHDMFGMTGTITVTAASH
ncbi:MAG TPA: cupredoxin domain-containing protein [Alphaproteobacteria bacterium]|nr:cupredoxin domain-containing protein [Alphaproteobacteria bacterium]